MNVIFLPSSRPFREALRLQIGMSERLEPLAFGRWRNRLQVFLLPRGLIAAVALDHVAVLPLGRSLTPDDRRLVVGWLIAQPEIVFVHIDRRIWLDQTSPAAKETHRG